MGNLVTLHRYHLGLWYNEVPDIERCLNLFFRTKKGTWIKEHAKNISERIYSRSENDEIVVEIIGVLESDQLIWFALQWGEEHVE